VYPPQLVGLFQDDAGVIDQIAGGEVVGSVENQVAVAKDVQRVVRLQAFLVKDHLDVGVDLLDTVSGGLGLGAIDVTLAVNDLALEVGLVDHVEVDDAQRSHARGGKVQQRGGAEAARAD